MVSWLIEFSKEADNYIDDNWELILNVYQAITELAKAQANEAATDEGTTYGKASKVA